MTQDRFVGRGRGMDVGIADLHEKRDAAIYARFLIDHLTPGMRVLDCGSGPGSITLGLAEAVAPGEVIGVDIDAGRVEEATELASERGVENVSFQQGSAYELPFPDGSFDAVYEHSMLQHLDDPLRAVKEVLRVLKPGGLFGASDKAAMQPPLRYPEDDGRLLAEFFEFFLARSIERGSDLKIGARLGKMMREAGFSEARQGVSYEVFEGERALELVASMVKLLSHPSALEFGLRMGTADQAKIDEFIAYWERLAEDPHGWHALTNGEALGRK